MPPDRPRGSGLRSSILKCTCLLKRQYPSTLKVNENSDKAIDRAPYRYSNRDENIYNIRQLHILLSAFKLPASRPPFSANKNKGIIMPSIVIMMILINHPYLLFVHFTTWSPLPANKNKRVIMPSVVMVLINHAFLLLVYFTNSGRL